MNDCRATGASSTPRSADPPAQAPCVAVAYSGGRDSTALLHATARMAAGQGLRVVALHVHHGLQPQADAWLAHGARQCAQWADAGLPVTFAACRLSGAPGRGDSVEAWARQERYRALARMARDHGATLVLLAHHRRDQAETFLLQALRGAGVAGLSAMPADIERDGLRWVRPWLERPREAIDAYVAHHRLAFVEDDSNADPGHARNRLRLSVWPALTGAFPQAEPALADAARWAQQAAAGLEELARLDLPRLTGARGLDLAAWATLSEARRANVLRHWMGWTSGRRPTASLLARLLRELPARGPACWIDGDVQWRRYRGWLNLAREDAGLAGPGPGAQAVALSPVGPRTWLAPGWPGHLEVQPVESGGLASARLPALRAVQRRGGERFQRTARGLPRSLKKQFQAGGVPSWARGGPLLFDGEQLVFVPGLGLDARAVADAGQPQVALRWCMPGPDAES